MMALRRAAWGLTAGLALASPALAQYAAHLPGQDSIIKPRIPTVLPVTTGAVPTQASGSYYTPDVPKGYVLQPSAHTTTVTNAAGMPAAYVLQAVDGQPVTGPVLDSHTILEEMKVELALLADPMTFGCNLSPKLDGKAMLVRGYVPNEKVRDHALEIARTSTHLPVADGLKIHPSLAMRGAGVAVAVLQQGAEELLAEEFPEIASSIEIKATVTGQITLTGSARSFEEKLAVSQRLRRLNGCTSVINQLKVSPLIKNGQSLTMVTSDGMHVVPPEIVMESPVTMTVLTTPVMQAPPPIQGTAIFSAMHNPSVSPVRPAVIQTTPIIRTPPSALPTPKAAGAVSQGIVNFGD